MKRILYRIGKEPEVFNGISRKIEDFIFLLFFKLEHRPRNFIWKIVPGYPQKMGSFTANDLFDSIDKFEIEWNLFKSTLLYEMKSGREKHPKGKLFNEKEIEFAKNRNVKPLYVIRVAKFFPVAQIDKYGKKVISLFKNETIRIKDIAMFTNQ